MKSIWLVLLFSSIATGLLPVFRFKKTIFFKFFLASALIDLAIVLITYFFHVHTYWFIPFITVVLLLALPTKSKTNIYISLLSALILIPVFTEQNWIPLLISVINSCFIILFFSEKIMEEYKSFASISLFLPVLWISSVIEAVKVYFYYRHLNLFLLFYSAFLIWGVVSPLVVSYLGYNKKYLFKKKIKDDNEKLRVDLSNRETTIPADKLKLIASLGKRELEVLTLISTGIRQKEIAEKLFIENETVYFHTRNIREKLEIDTTPGLYKFAFEMKDVIGWRGTPKKKNNTGK